MNIDTLMSEGRRLGRPCVMLRAGGKGPVAGIWHQPDSKEIDKTGHRCWITVDAQFLPGLSKTIKGFLSVFTDEIKCQGGQVEVNSAPPERLGIELHAYEESVLPPIDAVFVRGSD